MSVVKWKKRLTDAWKYASEVEGVFRLGNMLEEAKAELRRKGGGERGEWMDLIQTQLPFSQSAANKIMTIADNKMLLPHAPRLPASWGTLYELTKLTETQFAAGIKAGSIHPRMERKDAIELRSKRKRAA